MIIRLQRQQVLKLRVCLEEYLYCFFRVESLIYVVEVAFLLCHHFVFAETWIFAAINIHSVDVEMVDNIGMDLDLLPGRHRLLIASLLHRLVSRLLIQLLIMSDPELDVIELLVFVHFGCYLHRQLILADALQRFVIIVLY